MCFTYNWRSWGNWSQASKYSLPGRSPFFLASLHQFHLSGQSYVSKRNTFINSGNANHNFHHKSKLQLTFWPELAWKPFLRKQWCQEDRRLGQVSGFQNQESWFLVVKLKMGVWKFWPQVGVTPKTDMAPTYQATVPGNEIVRGLVINRRNFEVPT